MLYINISIPLMLLLFFSKNFFFTKHYRILRVILVYYIIYTYMSYFINFCGSSSYLEFINIFNSRYNIIVIYIVYICVYYNLYKVHNIYICTYVLLTVYNDIHTQNSVYLFNIIDVKLPNNTNLLNGIMLIHPPILYYFYSNYMVILWIYFNNSTVFKKYFFCKKYFSTAIIYWIFCTIILGCWWAEQELLWGGWWNWDFVEILAITYIFNVLRYLHTNTSYSSDINMKSIKFLAAMLVISNCSVRFNLVNSIHNFVVSESQNQYYYYIYSILLYCYVCCMNVGYKTDYKIHFFKNVFLFFCVISLGSEFIKIVFFFFKIKHIYIYVTIFVLVIYVCVIRFNYVYLITLLITTNNFLFCFFLQCLVKFWSTKSHNIRLLHSFMFLFIILTLKQIFLFKAPENLFLNQVLLVKINLFNQLESIFFKKSFYLHNSVHINTNVFNLTNICINISTDLYKNIPEKKLFLIDNSLNELLNFNFNVLIQPFNLALFMSTVLFLIFFKSLFFLKTSLYV